MLSFSRTLWARCMVALIGRSSCNSIVLAHLEFLCSSALARVLATEPLQFSCGTDGSTDYWKVKNVQFWCGTNRLLSPCRLLWHRRQHGLLAGE